MMNYKKYKLLLLLVASNGNSCNFPFVSLVEEMIFLSVVCGAKEKF